MILFATCRRRARCAKHCSGQRGSSGKFTRRPRIFEISGSLARWLKAQIVGHTAIADSLKTTCDTLRANIAKQIKQIVEARVRGIYPLAASEPALQHQLHPDEVIGQLVEREFLVFVASPPQGYFKDMARLTGGKWYQIAANTRFDDLLNLFRDLARKVSQVVFDVYQIGDGSVADYLRLKPPGK